MSKIRLRENKEIKLVIKFGCDDQITNNKGIFIIEAPEFNSEFGYGPTP